MHEDLKGMSIKKHILSPINVDVLIMLQAAFDVQSSLPIPLIMILGLAKKRRYWDWESYNNLQNPYLGLENGRRYCEGGGIGRGG